MRRRRALGWAAVLAGVGAALAALAWREPQPGKHGWLTALAGDWSIRMTGTEYEIGKSVRLGGLYSLFRWAEVQAPDGRRAEVPQELIENLVSYACDGRWVVARTTDGVAWLDLETGELFTERANDTRPRLPPALHPLLARQTKPRPSLRYHLLTAGALAWGAALVVAVRGSARGTARS